MMIRKLFIVPVFLLTGIAAAEAAEPARPSPDRQVRRFQHLIDAGRLDEAAAVAEQAAEAHPGNPAAQLMLRHIEVLRQPPADAAAAGRTSEPRLITAVYDVADLVVPVPAEVEIRIHQPATGTGTLPPRQQPDFEPFLNAIKRRVGPDAWGENGGSIAVHKQTLSIVVRQTPEAHSQIADLLRELRRERDVQLSLEVRWLEVPDRFFETLGSDFDWETTGFADSRSITCDAADQKRLLAAAQQDARGNIALAPKVTLFDGQVARLAFAGHKERLLHATVSNDRRRVRLKVAEHSDDATDVLADAEVHSLADGQSLLLDAGVHITGPADGTPDNKIPWIGRLFKNTERQTTRRLLLVTPRILVREEAEELLDITASGASRRPSGAESRP